MSWPVGPCRPHTNIHDAELQQPLPTFGPLVRVGYLICFGIVAALSLTIVHHILEPLWGTHLFVHTRSITIPRADLLISARTRHSFDRDASATQVNRLSRIDYVPRPDSVPIPTASLTQDICFMGVGCLSFLTPSAFAFLVSTVWYTWSQHRLSICRPPSVPEQYAIATMGDDLFHTKQDDHDSHTMIATVEDWRTFRAKMAGSINKERTQIISKANLEVLLEQAPELSGQQLWAHELPGPEKGCLVVAQPHFFEGNWMEQAVIFILEHSEEGSLGLVLNRPSPFKLAQLMKGENRFSKNMLYVGGHDQEHTMVIHPYNTVKRCVEVIPGVFMGGEVDLEGTEADEFNPDRFKFFAGYTRWAPGALERQCRNRKWWPIAAAAPLILRPILELPKPFWREVLELCGGELAKIAQDTEYLEYVYEGREKSKSEPNKRRPDGHE